MPGVSSMGLSVRVYSDYVCPYCFLTEAPLYEAIESVSRESSVAIEVEWMPYELRPEPNPTLRPEGDYLQTGWARSVYPLARQLGIEIRLPSVSPQPYSRLAFEGSLFAKQKGKLREYNHAVFCAFFQEDRDIGRIDVLRELAEQTYALWEEHGNVKALRTDWRQQVKVIRAVVAEEQANDGHDTRYDRFLRMKFFFQGKA